MRKYIYVMHIRIKWERNTQQFILNILEIYEINAYRDFLAFNDIYNVYHRLHKRYRIYECVYLYLYLLCTRIYQRAVIASKLEVLCIWNILFVIVCGNIACVFVCFVYVWVLYARSRVHNGSKSFSARCGGPSVVLPPWVRAYALQCGRSFGYLLLNTLLCGSLWRSTARRWRWRRRLAVVVAAQRRR